MPTRKKPKSKPKAPKRVAATKSTNGISKPSTPHPIATPPARVHSSAYHYPLLLDDQEAADALLQWFEGIEEARSMPWRKSWIDPATFTGSEGELAEGLAKRAYEIWVSEIMLQQTRVSTVIPYFNTWISKWPTIHALAAASNDDVLSAWKGLGYYSRATRLHQGAQAMVAQNPSGCPIPSKAEDLMKFPGIGKYTAGAVSSIAFGEAEPVLDGNVVRVLSRQLGVFADGKDKKVSDVLWEVADLLVKNVAGYPEVERSKVPSQWNQAIMELGSTICTPRPKCDECPIRKTCRAYAEGKTLSEKDRLPTMVPDIEDVCTMCEQLDTEDLVAAPEQDDEEVIAEKPSKKRKVEAKATNTISNYFAVKAPNRKTTVDNDNEDGEVGGEVDASPTNGSVKRKAPTIGTTSKSVLTYCSLFPKKIPKKKVAEEECAVCIIELQRSSATSKWLIEQRPAKGLLASLWQFPQCALPVATNTASSRKSSAQKFVSGLNIGEVDMSEAKHIAELGSLVHVFSHLRLTMHVQLFRLAPDKAENHPKNAIPGPPACKWVETDAMDSETLSTGMRRCWDLNHKPT